MPGRGTVNQLLTLMERIHCYRDECRPNRCQNIKPCNYVVLVLLDCSRAFDVFNRTLLLSRLHKMGVRGALLEMVSAFYAERFQKVKVGNLVSSVGTPERGGPQGSVITLLSFLVLINDIGESITGGEKDLQLFVDDVAFIEFGTKASEVVKNINRRLEKVRSWSGQEGIAFPFKKFHLINIGQKKLPGCWKERVRYGDNTPPWSLRAKYLGVVIDHHLNLRAHMKRVAEKMEKSMLYLSNNSNYVTGSSPEILLKLFQSYVFPQLLYGAQLWVFGLREKFRYDEPIVRGYGESWKKLKSLYRRSARWILGVHPNTSGEAVLVRLGWLSLDYLLALHALKLFIKFFHGHGGNALQVGTVERGNDLGGYGHGVFFKRAHEFLTYLNVSSGEIDLFAAEILKDDKPLRKALFQDLDRCWQKYEGAEQTRELHKQWRGTSINLNMRSKTGTSLLHGACCSTGVLRCDLSKSGLVTTNKCRNGCSEKETLKHIILECPHFDKNRVKLSMDRRYSEKCLMPPLSEPGY